ncbi:MAG: hypothetical protein K2I30_04685 [Clostridia bacterium]|nr:hypothetical protein [Clostridia bacterium]
MRQFTVEFHLCDSEYMTALRLVSGAVCSAADTDIDALEDFKVCVTESALILKNCGFEKVRAEFQTASGVSCTLSGLGGFPQAASNELSLSLIRALVSGCGIKSEGGIISKVTLKI